MDFETSMGVSVISKTLEYFVKTQQPLADVSVSNPFFFLFLFFITNLVN